MLEEFLPLTSLPNHLSLRRIRSSCGHRLHPSTIFRWATRGIGGVKLQTWKVGRQRVTTEEALLRFFEATGMSAAPSAAAMSSHRRNDVRKRAVEAAKRDVGL